METPSTGNGNVKQIRVRKVLFYSILSLGIYVIVWLVKRHRELDEPQPSVPHWMWLVSIFATLIISLIVLVIVTAGFEDTRQGAEVSVYGSYALALAASLGAVWWTARYGIAINRSTQSPLSTVSIVLLAIFFTPALVALTQYAVNRPLDVRKTLGSVLQRAAMFVVVAGVLLAIPSFMVSPLDIEKEITLTQESLEELRATINSEIE